jgi:hypothetical protein
VAQRLDVSGWHASSKQISADQAAPSPSSEGAGCLLPRPSDRSQWLRVWAPAYDSVHGRDRDTCSKTADARFSSAAIAKKLIEIDRNAKRFSAAISAGG